MTNKPNVPRTLKVIMESHDYGPLETATKTIIDILKPNFTNRITPIYMPVKKRLFNLNRSTFIYGSSKLQLHKIERKIVIMIKLINAKCLSIIQKNETLKRAIANVKTNEVVNIRLELEYNKKKSTNKVENNKNISTDNIKK